MSPFCGNADSFCLLICLVYLFSTNNKQKQHRVHCVQTVRILGGNAAIVFKKTLFNLHFSLIKHLPKID